MYKKSICELLFLGICVCNVFGEIFVKDKFKKDPNSKSLFRNDLNEKASDCCMDSAIDIFFDSCTQNKLTSNDNISRDSTDRPHRLLNESSVDIPNHKHNITLLKKYNYRTESSGVDHNSTDAAFLTFNEWKKAKINDVPRSFKRMEMKKTTKHSEYNRVEAIGEDMEIDLKLFTSTEEDEPEGKIHKEKINYASLDCAATVVKTNSEAKGVALILLENKDKYLLNPCSANNQFIVIELCQDILVEEIVMANFEYFSSTFRHLRFSVSDRFPVLKSNWKILGEFEAENSRDLQKFEIKTPMIWARYLMIEILSHYENEFYCPISVIRAHGKTMMDEFKMESLQKEQETGLKTYTGQDTNIISIDSNGTCIKPWKYFSSNMTSSFDWDDLHSQCRAVFTHLKFDEFIKELNTSETGNFNVVTPNSYTEESIFKNMINRLNSLETNVTLSILYIDEQSRLLSDAFSNLEKAQKKKINSLIKIFNLTIIQNIESLNMVAGQLNDNYLKLIKEMRSNNDQFIKITNRDLEDMKQDLLFLKRLIYVIMSVIILILSYIFLTKETYIKENMSKDGIISNNLLEKSKLPESNYFGPKTSIYHISSDYSGHVNTLLMQFPSHSIHKDFDINNDGSKKYPAN